MITQKKLKEVLKYNPDTGVFIWLAGQRNGKIAGCLNKTIGYRQIMIAGKMYYAHRLIFLYMTGEFPINEVDHINCIKSDNRWDNLRDSTHSYNGMNYSTPSDNTSGIKGVDWHKQGSKWRARLRILNKDMSLGLHKDFKDAVLARYKAELTYDYPMENSTAYKYLEDNKLL